MSRPPRADYNRSLTRGRPTPSACGGGVVSSATAAYERNGRSCPRIDRSPYAARVNRGGPATNRTRRATKVERPQWPRLPRA